MAEIPAETAYLASSPNNAVCKGWVVEVIGLKLVTHHPVIEPSLGPRAGIASACTGLVKIDPCSADCSQPQAALSCR